MAVDVKRGIVYFHRFAAFDFYGADRLATIYLPTASSP